MPEPADPTDRPPVGLARRELLKRGVLAGLALGLPSFVPRGAFAAEPPQVRGTRTLGRTGLRVSDIGFGSSQLAGDESLVRHALERGVTYFDTAESYEGGRSEETLGRALAGARDRVVLASKTSCGARTPRAELMTALEGSLRRLRTDRIDVYFNHAVNDLARLQNPEWAEFATRARQQGKIRFTGMSGHGGRLVPCLDFALENDLVDVVLVGYNFGQDPSFSQRFTSGFDFVAVNPELPQALARARAKNVGVVAMKTLRGGRLNDLRPYETDGATFAQAAFRWTLASPNVDALVVSMTSRPQIDEYLVASGWQAPSRADLRLLERYEARNGATQCRYGCSACLSSCPASVSIPDLLRARMYAEDYRAPGLARAAVREAGVDTQACLSCAEETCAGACPYGLDIPALTRRARAAIAAA